MAQAAAESIATPSMADFETMLEASLEGRSPQEGSVIRGTIVAVENDFAVVDVGLKTEGRVALKEFSMPGQPPNIKVGDEVEVYLERVENAMGEAVLSRDKARREESWIRLEKAFNDEERVTGVIFGRVKGGFTVDLDGAVAFLPGQPGRCAPDARCRPADEPAAALPDPENGSPPRQHRRFAPRGSRRAPRRRAFLAGRLPQGRPGRRRRGQEHHRLRCVRGSGRRRWPACTSPISPGAASAIRRKCCQVGENVTVQIIKINQDTQRISLGMKQLQTDPWEGVGAKYPVVARFQGKVTNVTDYGAFVELEPGVEGLVHVSEMSWVKKNVAPSKIVTPGSDVEVQVLEVDSNKRRISLGLKQCMENPWQGFAASHPPGTEIEGEIKSITEFGLFVGLDGDIDGMVHLSDLSWDKSGDEAVKDYQKGQMVKAKVLDIDADKERVSLGIKQLDNDPMDQVGPLRRGTVVTCTVTEVNDGGIEVSLVDGVKAFIRRADLARDRADQRPERFGVGDKVDALVTSYDKASRRISLSIKAREISEEKDAVAQYGSSDSGASLGDILGAALKGKRSDDE